MYCHHSVGIGHLVRSLGIITALRADYDITLISGGEYPEGIVVPTGIQFHQLPAVRLANDTTLIDVTGNDTISDVMSKRKQMIKDIYKSVMPDVIITELFPFGRMQFIGEIMPILKLAKSGIKKTLVFSSLRDIVEPTTAKKKIFRDFAFSIINTYYDGIFLHADEKICRLEDTLDYEGKIKVPVHHTGYVTKQKKLAVARERGNGVIASFGGGGISSGLINMLIDAYKDFGFGEGRNLKIIAGPLLDHAKFESLERLVADIPGITLVKQVSNLIEELSVAEVSISQCGYNTAIEILCTGIPALVIPYYNEQNSEQVIRAVQLERLSLVKHLSSVGISAEILAAAIRETFAFQPAQVDVELNGAENTRVLLNALLQEAIPEYHV